MCGICNVVCTIYPMCAVCLIRTVYLVYGIRCICVIYGISHICSISGTHNVLNVINFGRSFEALLEAEWSFWMVKNDQIGELTTPGLAGARAGSGAGARARATMLVSL